MHINRRKIIQEMINGNIGHVFLSAPLALSTMETSWRSPAPRAARVFVPSVRSLWVQVHYMSTFITWRGRTNYFMFDKNDEKPHTVQKFSLETLAAGGARSLTPLCLQWEPQHQDLSCEQFQQWKRENDPEYQRQGLAGYLRDNGISEATDFAHNHQFHFNYLTSFITFV